MFNGIAIGDFASVCVHPSKCILVRELNVLVCNQYCRPSRWGIDANVGGGYVMHGIGTSNPGGNFAYADGHAKFKKQSTITWNANRRMWNFDNGRDLKWNPPITSGYHSNLGSGPDSDE
jgi:prepilin-type processing-associated H-X9-DG protein